MLTHPAEALRLWDSVVTIGAFDGVHRGHQALIRRAVDRATRLGVPSVAYTFDPPPKAVFGDAPVLTARPEKARRLEALGLDHAVVATFDAAYAARSAEDFLEELADLNPFEIWVGPDFRFGRGQAGDVKMLAQRFAVRTLEPVQCLKGRVISSTRVRELLQRGALGEAQSLLGWNAGGWSAEQSLLGWYPGCESEAPLLFYSGSYCFPELQPRELSYIW
jgi:riboflavin kinase/FMN adenylyltransferase